MPIRAATRNRHRERPLTSMSSSYGSPPFAHKGRLRWSDSTGIEIECNRRAVIGLALLAGLQSRRLRCGRPVRADRPSGQLPQGASSPMSASPCSSEAPVRRAMDIHRAAPRHVSVLLHHVNENGVVSDPEAVERQSKLQRTGFLAIG